MAKDMSRKQEQRGTRQLMLWGAGIAALLFILILAWSLAEPNLG